MIRLNLDTKKCMAELLLHDTFDRLLFIEGEITTFNTFTIDGFLHREFYRQEDFSEDSSNPSLSERCLYSAWEQLREFCFSIIKGKRTPLNFKFIFSLPESDIIRLITEKHLEFQAELIQGLYLNFRFDGTGLSCTTGTSLTSFTLDKSLEHGFDQWTRDFFSAHGINWEEA